MSRGIVLWPDGGAETTITRIWADLADQGIATLATQGHRRHRPHLSLVVAEDLPPDAALHAVGSIPEHPFPFAAEAIGVFPDGTLFLACVVNQELLDEHRRVHRAVEKLSVDPWPFYEPGRWTPHVTIGNGLGPGHLDVALGLLSRRLPITGTFEAGGVEDASTGERWMTAGDPQT